MRSNDIQKFLVTPDRPLKLERFGTALRDLCPTPETYEKELEREKKKMSKLQELLYAENDQALLIIFQGMDAAGKDGMIKHVMSGLNPQGVMVTSFKRPSEEELNHGIFWRHDRALPEHGRIGIWNRSHYEEVLVVRVRPELLRTRGIQPVPFTDKFWRDRLKQIRNWEELQHDTSRVTTIKFFLNISKEEQAQRLLERIEDRDKNWKFEAGDMEERKRWDDYQRAFHDLLERTSTKKSPWYVIPADNKRAARLLASRIINHHLEEMEPRIPKAKTPAADLQRFAAELRAELGKHS